MKVIISLWAGVQSSTMALMAACGEIDLIPDGAIFADTQAEPKAVYEWLDWLEKQLPFPVFRVTAGNLEEASLKVHTGKSGKKYTKHAIPYYTLGQDGHKGMNPRQCTGDFKIVPIKRKIREIMKQTGEKKVIQWLGISYDEIVRMKPSRVKYIKHVYPLIEKRMTRQDCLSLIKSHHYPEPPRSACYFCPFHSDSEWGKLTEADMKRASEYEFKLSQSLLSVHRKHSPYLHKYRIPIRRINFKLPDLFDGSFNNECEGHCGV